MGSTKEHLAPPNHDGYSPDKLPLNPFEQAESMYFGVMGTFRKAAFNWRLMAFGLFFLNLVVTGAFAYETTKIKVVPVFFEKDSSGRVELMDIEKNRTPTQRQIEHFLEEFVDKTRSITRDDVENRKKWEKVYTYLQDSAANRMDVYTTNDKTFDRWGKELCSVNIKVVAPVTENTYQVRWREQVFGIDGRLKDSYNMTALFTVDIIPGKTLSEVKGNPYGISIKDFSWRREQ
ncbi:VirB8/TrbF family protein [Sporomusa sphaeroides]|uniref:VirB8 protein n=1 Tax=Sporomusa sphaeroides DSM 2875 TaxID=1337886 RepID=A0A1U7MA44_9FIRM|nr:VirB8/TrbF family protein [Sporomusa sphaeroides]OLS54306.1 VirB8 protein [Sporomusa sphaeroides DSM 2875]CVK21536.1 VirB8 protein [Sporomusa sphaeroides DSM 2875]